MYFSPQDTGLFYAMRFIFGKWSVGVTAAADKLSDEGVFRNQ